MAVYRGCIISTLLYGSVLDNTCGTGKTPGSIRPALLAAHPFHLLAGPHYEQCCLRKSRYPIHIYPPSPETPVVDMSCPSNRRGPHPQGTLVRRTSTRKKAGETNKAPLQRRSEEAIARHWSSNLFVGDSGQWHECVENKLHWSPTRGRIASAHHSGCQERTSEGQGSYSTCWFHLCL